MLVAKSKFLIQKIKDRYLSLQLILLIIDILHLFIKKNSKRHFKLKTETETSRSIRLLFQQVHSIEDKSKKVYPMEKVSKFITSQKFMMEILSMEKNKAMENIHIQMELFMKDSFQET
jgi:hypothetical protein